MKIILLFSFLLTNAYGQERKGLTWGLYPSTITGHTNVSCHGKPAAPNSPSCDAYVGDTSCQESRPILCINKKSHLKRPKGFNANKYNEWSGGMVQLTDPIVGNQIGSLEAANDLCLEYFGRGWRMAEFHDGWGWGFVALGKLKSANRFWVYINDQEANCWNGSGEVKDEPRLPDIGMNLKNYAE